MRIDSEKLAEGQAAAVNDDLIFEKAIAITDARERAQYILEACGDDLRQREHVDRLIASYFAAEGFMEGPAAIALDTVEEVRGDVRAKDVVGDQIGAYQLVEELGQGGMAVVYRARQRRPVDREVALKITKSGLHPEQTSARLQLESQALAVMEHRNIAKLLDAGMTEDGRPFYAMELVRGRPITDFCEQNNVPLADRIRLLQDVCKAVGHAHRKGIIHRDLKPSNILVQTEDNTPEIKVIDFGIAKIQSSFDDSRDGLTGMGQLIGTPQYMSPEQASLDRAEVDTRSDIYSIGAVLYELLTGRTLFPVGPILDTLQHIRFSDPPPPSRLNRAVHADLQAICMKCLEKDPNRRYQNTDELEQELASHLQGLPVEARQIGVASRLLKWARRSPLAASLIAVCILAVASLLVVWASFTIQLKQQRDEIASTSRQLDLQRQHALQNFTRAHQAIQKSLSIRTHTPLGATRTLLFQRHLLEAGISFYEELLRENEQGQQLSSGLKQLQEARLEQANLYLEYGKVLLAARENEDAAEACRRAISISGELAAQVPASGANVEALRLKGVACTSLVQVLKRLQDWERALEAAHAGLSCYEELIARGELDADYKNWYLALSWIRIGQVHMQLGDIHQAEIDFQNALNHSQQLSGVYDFQLTHSDVLYEIARWEHRQANLPRALDFVEQAIAIVEDICVRSTPPLQRYELGRIRCLSGRARIFRDWSVEDASDQTAGAKAKSSYEEAIAHQRNLVDRYPDTEQYVLDLAGMYEEYAQLGPGGEDSQRLVQKALDLRRELDESLLEPEQLMTVARMRLDRAGHELSQSAFESSARQFQEALDLLSKLPESQDNQIVSELRKGTHYRLATTYFGLTQFDAARQHFESYLRLGGAPSDEVLLAHAVCLALADLPEQAADVLKKVEKDFSTNNVYWAYRPLAELRWRELRDGDARLRRFLEEMRAVVEQSAEMTDLQLHQTAYALCLATTLLQESTDSEDDTQEFIAWAKRSAIDCLQRSIRSGRSLAREILLDARVQCLVGEPGFAELADAGKL